MRPDAARKRGSIGDLKLWQRFDVRLTVFYGSFILVTLVLMIGAFYNGGVKIAMDGIRERLAGTSVAIAHSIDPDKLAQLRDKADKGTPAYKALFEDFAAISDAEKDVLSIYVLVPTEKPGIFKFAFDFVAPGKRTVVWKVFRIVTVAAKKILEGGLHVITSDTSISAAVVALLRVAAARGGGTAGHPHRYTRDHQSGSPG